ncbi:MAG: TRAP transporter TatT component family protein [Spirochaetaceae bacterium]|jgi:predicted anti-sigma-YlaC factor YlaD|nr:TRAP transporter TatT component family protein [Spirochaetaceae bacterium]
MKKFSMIVRVCPLLFIEIFLVACASSPTMVGFALPRIINSDEKKLEKDPANAKLRLETGSYYVMYANAFVQGPAEMLPASEYLKKEQEQQRAKELYLRGVAILREGLEEKYPGINNSYAEKKLDSYLTQLDKDDVPLLYWMVAGSLAAYSIDPMGEMALGLRLGELGALIKQAYKLDPDFNKGALDDFFILYYGSLPPALGGDKDLAKFHYESALRKSQGLSASPYVSWAQAIAIPEQNYASFKENLEKALAVDISKSPSSEDKLANKIAQTKARYLLKNADSFIIPDDENNGEED